MIWLRLDRPKQSVILEYGCGLGRSESFVHFCVFPLKDMTEDALAFGGMESDDGGKSSQVIRYDDDE